MNNQAIPAVPVDLIIQLGLLAAFGVGGAVLALSAALKVRRQAKGKVPFAQALAEGIIGRRLWFLLLTLAATAVFGWRMAALDVRSETIDLFPTNHNYVETFLKYQDTFGGASSVVVMVEVKQGDIFVPQTLDKIRQVTKTLELLPGINNYQVLSIAQRKVKDVTVEFTAEGPTFRTVPIMWPDIPQTPEDIAKLKELVYSNRRIHGSLVSLDSRAALIVAGFFEQQYDPKLTYERLDKILQNASDGNTTLRMIGRPVMLGEILANYGQLLWLFLATLGSMLLVLTIYFRDARGVLIPTVTAVMSAVWGLGFLALMDGLAQALGWSMRFNFDPLIIVVPFIVSARALSHSVQLIERFLEEYHDSNERRAAAVATFRGLFKPGMLSIVTDAAGVLVVAVTPIPLMQKLAYLGGFWVLSIIISDLVFNPVILSYLPAPRRRTDKVDFMAHHLGRLARWCCRGGRWIVVGATGLVFAGGFLLSMRLVVGDVHPGTPMLWPDSRYNRDSEAIAEKFGNTEILNVVVEGRDRNAIKSPTVLQAMWDLQREMEMLPEVGATASLADTLPPIISALHANDPKWELIPQDLRDSGFFLELIYSSAEPGDLARFVTQDSKNANISIYLRDHKGETLRTVVDRAKAFMAMRPLLERDCPMTAAAPSVGEDLPGEAGMAAVEPACPPNAPLKQVAQFRLAGGYGGLLAAVNEVIITAEARVTILAFGIVFLFCWLAYRSLVAAVLFLVPLVLSNYLTYALMGARGIGLDVNALPVVALGVGLGVDYGLYIVSRIQEEYQKTPDLIEAIVRAISTAGKAVLFTASTMVFGVVFWAFSFLRFQADMGLLMVFWMVVSMLGGLILLPTLLALIKPKFIARATGW